MPSKNKDMRGLLAFCHPLRFGLIFEIVYDARSKSERATADPAKPEFFPSLSVRAVYAFRYSVEVGPTPSSCSS